MIALNSSVTLQGKTLLCATILIYDLFLTNSIALYPFTFCFRFIIWQLRDIHTSPLYFLSIYLLFILPSRHGVSFVILLHSDPTLLPGSNLHILISAQIDIRETFLYPSGLSKGPLSRAPVTHMYVSISIPISKFYLWV